MCVHVVSQGFPDLKVLPIQDDWFSEKPSKAYKYQATFFNEVKKVLQLIKQQTLAGENIECNPY